MLWRNTGKASFTDVTRRAGIDDTRWGTSCAFADYDRDGDLDLYVANYVKFDDSTIPGARHDGQLPVHGHRRLLRPEAADRATPTCSTATTATARSPTSPRAAGVIDPGYYGFGVVFTDLNDDGWPDIYVANDSVPNLLFRNRKDGTFVEEGLLSGAALSGDGRPQAGMGVDAGDYNGDGLPDLIVTNFSHDHNTLYENGPAGVFTDRSYATGIAATAGPYLGWGVKFVDIDNDGRLDVVHRQRPRLPRGRSTRTGHALSPAEAAVPQRGEALPPRHRGRRRRAAAREVEPRRGVRRLRQRRRHRRARDQHERSADAAAQRHRARRSLDHASPGRARRATATAIGAKVTVEAGGRRQTTAVRGDGSYLSHSDLRAHFGLGAATRVTRVEIRWPSGVVQNATGLAADRFYVVREGEGVIPGS